MSGAGRGVSSVLWGLAVVLAVPLVLSAFGIVPDRRTARQSPHRRVRQFPILRRRRNGNPHSPIPHLPVARPPVADFFY
ncbi:MAG: hypothetical protein IPI64_11285 [Chloracidobacterium sp.]|nr:hypothetical protein [Chloracidobacterium sp.]